jgi:hypothetical protein
MRKAKHLPLLFWLTTIGLCSCHSSLRPDGQERQLLALADSIELEVNILDLVSAEEAISASQWAQENLREFELLLEDDEMSISREEGEIISDVSRARRLLKDQSKRRESIANSQKRTLLQLRGLAQAIGNGATHDSQGTPIDSAYIARNLSRELQMGRALKKSITETQTYASQGIAIAERTKGRSDSLQTILRGQLAQLILERNSSE